MLTKSGKSAVHIAAGYPNIAMLDCLIDYGAPFDTVDNKGVMPLFFAARRGELGIVTALMKRGARHVVTDATGETLLHIAVSHIWPEVVDIVLWTQSLNALDIAGRSPLHHAYFTSAQVSYGGLLYVMTADEIRRLVDKGSSETIADSYGRIPKDYSGWCRPKHELEWDCGYSECMRTHKSKEDSENDKQSVGRRSMRRFIARVRIVGRPNGLGIHPISP